MTKTKKQLRAEAVERLKRLQDRSPLFDSDVGAAIADGGLLSDVIDLLNDDDSTISEDESTTESLSDVADSRERLEADIEAICWGNNDDRYFAQKRYLQSAGIEADDGNVMANHEGHVLMTVIMHLLDRQDAITRAEWCSEQGWWDSAEECNRATAKVHDMQAQVDELTAERDNWKANCEDWKKHARAAENACYETMLERDAYREKLSKALDLAHEIGRLQP